MARDVRDETGFGLLIEDLLPESAWGIEVFRMDLGEEGDSLVDELAVNLVQINDALTETDWLDGGEVIGTGTLVVEGHVAITLKVTNAVACSG